MDEINVAPNPQDAAQAAPSADTQSFQEPDGAAPSAETSMAPTIDKTISYKWMHADEILDLSKEEDRQKASEWLREGRYSVEKGKEYTKKLESELDALKKPLSPIAQRLGKDVKEVPELFAKQWQAAEDAKLAKAQGKPVQDVTALREAQEAKEAAEAKARELETAEQTRQRHIQETVEFNKTYPDIDIQKLPDEVIREWIDNGKPLVDVYRVYSYGEKEAEIQALKERIATMEQKEAAAKINAENADTAPGKLGSGEPADKPLTLADLDNLTPDEKKRRHPEIWALLTGRKT